MVFGCGNKCVKFCLFFVNFLICVSGAVLFGVSLWANLDKNVLNRIDEAVDGTSLQDDIKLSQYTTAIWVLVGVGGFLFLIGLLGCCGAACENRLLLGLFFVLVLICFLIELAAGIAAIVLKDKFKEKLEEVLKDAIEKDKDNRLPPKFEKELDCCGIAGHQNYCTDKTKPSCVTAIWDMLKKHAWIAGGVAIGILVIEVLAMIFACILCNAIGEKRSYYA